MNKIISSFIGIFFLLQTFGMTSVMADMSSMKNMTEMKNTEISDVSLQMQSCHKMINKKKNIPQKMECCMKKGIFSSSLLSSYSCQKKNIQERNTADFQKFLDQFFPQTIIEEDDPLLILLRAQIHQKYEISGFLGQKKITVLRI